MSRAIYVRELGGPEVLRLEDHDADLSGSPDAGMLRVKVEACGVNFIDVYFRTGLYPRPLPYIPGLEGAGVVEAVGSGCGGFAVGDRIAWVSAPNSYAETTAVPASQAVKLPEGVATEVAGAAMLQGMTAHYLAHGVRESQAGDTALVHAAAGGTGLLLVQMLSAAGVQVIGTCSTAEKEELARAAGARDVIRYSEVDDFAAEVKRLTDGRGVDVVYDSVGKTTFEGSLSSLRRRGLLCLFGQASGAVPPFDLNRLNGAGSLFVTRPTLAHYAGERSELEMRANAVLGAIAKGELDVRIGARFALADAGKAHSALEGRQTTGKVLLIP
jgi:NADPH2:quinone reductase